MTRGDSERIADIVAACSELAEVVAQRTGGGVSELVPLRARRRRRCRRRPVGDIRKWIGGGLGRFRIVLAHQYHRTDPNLVWQYAEHDVPALAKALTS